MTIEYSLRRRATHARYFAIVLLCIAAVVLVATCFSLPAIAGKTLDYLQQFQGARAETGSADGRDQSLGPEKTSDWLQLFALTTLVLGVSSVSFACFLLGKTAIMEMQLAGRLYGIADALCIAGNDLGQLEKAVVFLVPKGQGSFLNSKVVSTEDTKALLEILRKLR